MQAPFDLSKVPKKPGCYLYKNKDDKIIYIGKAKELKKRVSQYFTKKHNDLKTRLLVKHIVDVEFFITKTEVEALILEANLIKKHKPKYNIDLKAGRRYAYILVTDEKFPRILTARDFKMKGQYFGPFVSGYLRQTLIVTLRKAFFIRTCRRLPKKTCLRYHIGLCKAPCVGYQTKEEYDENIKEVVAYLKGKSDAIVKKLRNEMKEHAKKQEFESARIKRDQIQALEYLQEKQLFESSKEYQEDVINYVIAKGKVDVLVFNVRNGILGDKEEFTLEYVEGFFEEFLRRYYEDQGNSIPKKILVPEKVEDSISEYLSRRAGRKVDIVKPVKGARKALLDLVRKNLEVTKEAPTKAAEELQKNLGLEQSPRVVECFDISHLSGTNTVGSMVQFVDGKPHKSNYRRFKIRDVDGIDDFRSMHEVVYRRYKRLLDENKDFPDLIVIDGGSEQLAFALKALDEVGVEIPIIGLAKKFEEIYMPRKRIPLRFDKRSEMMKLLISCRDEAHRFGLKYQRLLRKKEIK